MKKPILGVMALAVVATAVNVFALNGKANVASAMRSGVEALAGSESGTFGCGRAVYEHKKPGIAGNKRFTLCAQGCPDGNGRDPMYIDC